MLQCHKCKADFSRPSWTIRYQRVFCGRVCAAASQSGAGNGRWNGGTKIASKGYRYIQAIGHPKATYRGKYAREHYLIAERALGRPLPSQAVIHHINGVKTDNDGTNLVICESNAYHQLLHARARRLKLFWSVNLKRCCLCKTVKHLSEFPANRLRWDGRNSACKLCVSVVGKLYYKRAVAKAMKLAMAP